MKKSIIATFLICSAFVSQAQNKCDSIVGKWVFTRWQTDQLLMDIEDSAATIKHKLQQVKAASNGASISASDSLELVNDLKEILESIRRDGFISFTLNKDKSFNWKGTVNDPKEQHTGSYSCNGNTITFINKQELEANKTEPITVQIIAFSKDRMTILLSPSGNADFKNNRMSFKRIH